MYKQLILLVNTNVCVKDVGMSVKNFFYFSRINIFATFYEHFFGSTDYFNKALLIHDSEIPAAMNW